MAVAVQLINSACSRKLIGKSLDEARLPTNKEIADELDLPGVKKHCSVLAESAVKSAIDNYLSKQEDDCVQNADEQMLSVNSCVIMSWI